MNTKIPNLLDNYAIVPAVYLKPSTTAVPEPVQHTREIQSQITQTKSEEEAWFANGIQLLSKGNLDKDHKVSWAAYYASRQEQSTNLPAITALFPLLMKNLTLLQWQSMQ